MKTAADPNRAFAAFGRLFAHVASFEQFMRLALGEREVKSGRFGKFSAEERERHVRKVMKLNFGQLRGRIETGFDLNADECLVLKGLC